MDFLGIYIVIGIIAVVFLVGYSIYNRKVENDFVDSARVIRKGMTKSEVVAILGSDYSYSCLKNGVEKYEWRYRKNGSSYRVAKGVSMRQSGYTRRISVKFKDGVVVETSSLNMD